jgi:hypothetical protein
MVRVRDKMQDIENTRPSLHSWFRGGSGPQKAAVPRGVDRGQLKPCAADLTSHISLFTSNDLWMIRNASLAFERVKYFRYKISDWVGRYQSIVFSISKIKIFAHSIANIEFLVFGLGY